MIFLSAQPHDPYFAWQTEVQIVNFRKFGISEKMHILVWFPDSEKRKQLGEPEEPFNADIWDKLRSKYPEVKIFYYQDEGANIKLYLSQLRPHIIARHFDLFPHLKNRTIFYHDSDIIFNFLPNLDDLKEGPIIWESDASSYLDYSYLLKKEKEGNIPNNKAILKLCEIGEIDVETLKKYDGRTGGAQVILKGVDGDFWRDVERMCLQIRQAFCWAVEGSINRHYFPNENAGFQSWCADMWALNMALWKRGMQTETTPSLDFSWATDDMETYAVKPIMHNAGADGTQPGIFWKRYWLKKSPIGIKHAVKRNSASWFYVKAIEEVTK